MLGSAPPGQVKSFLPFHPILNKLADTSLHQQLQCLHASPPNPFAEYGGIQHTTQSIHSEAWQGTSLARGICTTKSGCTDIFSDRMLFYSRLGCFPNPWPNATLEIMKSALRGVSAGKRLFAATCHSWIFIKFYPTGYALISSHTNFLALTSFYWLMIPTFNLIIKCVDMRLKKHTQKKV